MGSGRILPNDKYRKVGCFVAVVADVRESFCTADSLLLSSLLLLLRLLVCLLLLLLLLALRFVVVVLVGVVAVVYFSHCCTKGQSATRRELLRHGIRKPP